MKIIEKAGILALGTRMQRLIETLRNDGNKFYQSNGIEFETKWFPIIYVLSMVSHLSVTELATEIGLSHPALIALLKDLEKRDLISSMKDTSDERKRNVMLSNNGRNMVKELKPIWNIIEATLMEVTTASHNLFLSIIETEKKIEEKGFNERLNQKSAFLQSRENDQITVRLAHTDQDKQIIRAIYNEVFLRGSTSLDYMYDESKTQSYLASINGLPAGIIITRKEQYGPSIDAIAVLYHYRANGIAKSLIADQLSRSPYLSTMCEESGMMLLERLGFEKAPHLHNEQSNGKIKMQIHIR